MSLTQEFKKFSEEEFAAAFQKEVKNGDFRELLTWHTAEGIDVAPFYHSEKKISSAVFAHGNDWEVNDRVFIKDFVQANKTALEYLNSGVSSLTFVGEIKNEKELDLLLKNIGIEFIEICFIGSGKGIVQMLLKYCEANSIDKNVLRGCFHLPVSEVNKQSLVFPGMQTVCVSGVRFHEAGANIVQQLAYAVSEGKETTDKLIAQGILPEVAVRQIRFSVAVGPNFFFELAKIKALRILWRNITSKYASDNSALFIAAETSSVWLAADDANNNLIRASFQAVSAVLGGADSLYVHPYSDAAQALRLSRNVQLVIKEEGFLNKVADASGGAFYVEEITVELVEKSWEKFREIEKSGGFSAGLSAEIIQKDIFSAAQKTKKAIATGEIKVIGVNKHRADKTEKSFSELVYRNDLSRIDLFS